MTSDEEYQEIADNACLQIERNLIAIKPYLINIIKHGRKKLTDKDANEIIRKMISKRRIDEKLALSKSEKPYTFYIVACSRLSFDEIVGPIKAALAKEKKLTIAKASEVTGYSTTTARVILTHLLLMGEVDYSGDMESPIFFVPWG